MVFFSTVRSNFHSQTQSYTLDLLFIRSLVCFTNVQYLPNEIFKMVVIIIITIIHRQAKIAGIPFGFLSRGVGHGPEADGPIDQHFFHFALLQN